MVIQRVAPIRKALSYTLAILAVAVLFGFAQVSRDQADERTALQMILADLETDSVELTAQLSRCHTAERWAMWTLRNLDRDLPADSVLGGLTPLFYYTAYEQVRAGYLNLLYAGRLTVISDPELRQSLVAYFEQTHPFMWQFYAMYMEIYREFKETTASYVRMVPEPEGDVFVQSFHVEMSRPWVEMKRDTAFLYKLEELGGMGSQFGIRLGPALERNAALRAAIRAELGT